jgi:L-ascorbate metabolism protein UlaG (beta-lactamase superfamily)
MMSITHDGLAVEWLGYATTRIEGADTVVYLDPGRYGVLSGEWTPHSESARGAHPPARDYRAADGDAVFVTHRHHYDPDGIDRVARDDATIVTFEGIDVNGTDRTDVRPADLPYEVRRVGMETEGVVDGVPFWTVPAYNHPDGPHTHADGSPIHPEGFGCGYLVDVDGTRVFYPGDSDVLDGHAELDVSLFLPSIDDTFSMGGEAAVDLAAGMDPDLVCPVHYNTFDGLRADSRAFVADVAARGVPVVLDENR